MTWTETCGGCKIILEHANRLSQKGHRITLISHFPRPTWFNLQADIEFIQVPWDKILCESIPKCDLIIATYWREIYECIEQQIAPVIYFEQGDFHLFDTQKMDDRTRKYIQKQFEVVPFIYTISTYAKEKIAEEYKREDITIIPNAIDNNIFYFKEHPENEKINIALIGSQDTEFKRIDNILEAINILKTDGYEIKVNWITPTKPHNGIDAIVNPKQQVIGDTLRKSDIYICASMYESFCLPVLEAMACGAAVVTTDNGGNMDFVKDGENALVIEKDNIIDIVDKTKTLLNNGSLRHGLSRNAVRTAQNYTWDKTINSLEKYYLEIARYEVKK